MLGDLLPALVVRLRRTTTRGGSVSWRAPPSLAAAPRASHPSRLRRERLCFAKSREKGSLASCEARRSPSGDGWEAHREAMREGGSPPRD